MPTRYQSHKENPMLKEFQEFLEKFNVVPIAIGLVLAMAFLPVVDATSNVILSLVGAIFGAGVSFDNLTFTLNDTPIPYGTILTAIFSFILVAAVVFSLVKALNKTSMKTTPADTPDIILLREIRDAVKSS